MKTVGVMAMMGLLSAAVAGAGTIGPSCGSCFGGTYSLNGVLQSSIAGLETWRFTYTLETQGVTDSTISYVSSLAAKVTSSVILASTVTNPSGSLLSWTTPALNTNLNNSDCSGNGAGWICIAYTGLGGKLLTGASAASSYSWVFDATMAAGSVLSTASIQANFAPANGKILSEPILTGSVPLPEGMPFELPLMLTGFGLWMYAQARYRRRLTL